MYILSLTIYIQHSLLYSSLVKSGIYHLLPRELYHWLLILVLSSCFLPHLIGALTTMLIAKLILRKIVMGTIIRIMGSTLGPVMISTGMVLPLPLPHLAVDDLDGPVPLLSDHILAISCCVR